MMLATWAAIAAATAITLVALTLTNSSAELFEAAVERAFGDRMN
jgi:hypothetical protein